MSKQESAFQEFEDFKTSAEELFNNLAKGDAGHARLKQAYSFYVTPGGMAGGLDPKVLQVHFGHRPIGFSRKPGEGKTIQVEVSVESGAVMTYTYTDRGHVVCSLYPAQTSSWRPIEESIILDIVKKPQQLKRKARSHWRMFQAYMEGTCIDGSPSIPQRARYFRLRNFFRYVIGGMVQRTRFNALGLTLLKYGTTVGLSGFLVLVVNLKLMDSVADKQKGHQLDLLDIANTLAVTTEEIELRLQRIEQTIEVIPPAGDHHTALIASAVVELQTVNTQLEEISKKLEGKIDKSLAGAESSESTGLVK